MFTQAHKGTPAVCRYALACLRHLAATQASQDVMLQCSSAVVSTLQTYVGTPAVAVHCLACIGHLATAAASLYVFVCGVAWRGTSSPVWVVRLRRAMLSLTPATPFPWHAALLWLSFPPVLYSIPTLHSC